MPSKAALRAIEQREANAELQRSASTDYVSLSECKKIAQSKVTESKSKSSKLFSDIDASLDVIPQFSINELTLGKVLQRGKCSVVKEICGMHCNDKGSNDNEKPQDNVGSSFDDCKKATSDESTTLYDMKEQKAQDKSFIAEHCLREEDGGPRYVLKQLSPEKAKDHNIFTQGLVDMAIETMILSQISHPHILQLRAISNNSDILSPKFFFIIDKLIDTLDQRILKWKSMSKSANNIVNKLTNKSTSKLNTLLEIKLSYAYDLMGAIEYLHSNSNTHIVFRNLKPENVGFNVRDDIVLFGFGLAREVPSDEKEKGDTDGTWKMTGETGTLRYMAPEVALNQPYGYSADMYSFGIMLWEMLKMEKPFDNITHANTYLEMVVHRGARPKTHDEVWGPSLTGFIKSCWHQDLTKRPSAQRASSILKREASKALGGKNLELNNFRRKSTFVNRESLREKRITANTIGSTGEKKMTSVAEQMKTAAIEDKV